MQICIEDKNHNILIDKEILWHNKMVDFEKLLDQVRKPYFRFYSSSSRNLLLYYLHNIDNWHQTKTVWYSRIRVEKIQTLFWGEATVSNAWKKINLTGQVCSVLFASNAKINGVFLVELHGPSKFYFFPRFSSLSRAIIEICRSAAILEWEWVFFT